MKQNIRKFALGSFLAVSALQLAGCSASQGIEPSKVTCDQFFTRMQAKNLNSAYTLLSSKAKSVATPQQVQKNWDLLVSNKGNVNSWSQTGVNVYSGTGGSKVTLGYDVKCAKGAATTTFVCVNENDKWLIQSFNFNIQP